MLALHVIGHYLEEYSNGSILRKDCYRVSGEWSEWSVLKSDLCELDHLHIFTILPFSQVEYFTQSRSLIHTHLLKMLVVEGPMSLEAILKQTGVIPLPL